MAALHANRSAGSRLPAPRRRRQLLDTAIEVFAARGFHGTSMEDVADGAGVTKPVLYQHFSSKRELYLELLDDVGHQLVTVVIDAVASATGPRQQVEAGFAAYFRFVALQSHAFRLLFGSGARGDEDFADAVRRVEDRMAGVIAELVEAELSPDHRQLVGYGIVGLAEVTSRHWIASRAADDAAPDVNAAEAVRLAARVGDLAWAGLRGVHPDEL